MKGGVRLLFCDSYSWMKRLVSPSQKFWNVVGENIVVIEIAYGFCLRKATKDDT